MAEVVWRPTADVVGRANVSRLMRRHGIVEYRELVRRSCADPGWYWTAAVEDLGLAFRTPWQQVLDESRGAEWATWFRGATLNVADACVHRHARERPAAAAAIFRGEDGTRRELSFAELSAEVTRLAEALAGAGVNAGDRVGLFLPMSPEVAIASHACAHLGAVQVPVFSGFGPPAIGERLAHAGVKAVVCADGTLRRGNRVAMKEALDEALRSAPCVERVVVWRRLGGSCPMTPGRDVFWDEAVASSSGRLQPTWVESEQPYLIAYTSGTTGKPKGAVHVQGGFLVKIASEVAYHANAGTDDRILFATDMGWIMGPWTVVGAGATGTAIVFAEGAPDYPVDRLWRICEEEGVSILGISPTLVRSLVPHGEELVRARDLSSLRAFVTTGEPWNPGPYRWLFEEVGLGRVPIVNISGGTEVGAAFLSCTPVEPIKECSLGFPSPGMAVDVVDADGVPVPAGEVGELVCRRPWPGMTRGFWQDDERYLETYWKRFPGVWVHGDWASVDEDGCWYLHGRSDDTLNIAGKRIGPAELESAAVVRPCGARGGRSRRPTRRQGRGRVALLCRRPSPRSDRLADEIADAVGGALGKAFRPERVVFVPSLPKTRSAKIVRRAVRAAALGTDPGDLSAVENPDALAQIARAI